MDRPVRGSFTDGGRGPSSAGENPFSTLSLSHTVFCWAHCVTRVENFFENTIGASEVVSAPIAIPLSIWPEAILAAIPIAACMLVPHACIMVMPGVEGASFEPITASRARFQSLECV